MKLCGIYMITNEINGKKYIGQSVDIEKRWESHKYKSAIESRNYYLYNAIKKYGIENFTFSIVELCDRTELNDKEIYYISKYNTYVYNKDSCGYNMTVGGTDSLGGKHHPVFCITNGIGYTSMTVAEARLGVSWNAIYYSCKKHKNPDNRKKHFSKIDFCYAENVGNVLENNWHQRHAVINLSTMEIYASAMSASKATGIDRRKIMKQADLLQHITDENFTNNLAFLYDFLLVFPSTDIDLKTYITQNDVFC